MAKGLIIGGAVVVVVVVVAIVIGVLVVTRATAPRPSPEPFVEAYLGAISDGDASAARAIDDSTVAGVAGDRVDSETFRSDEALSSATERISDVTIDESEVYGNSSARVTTSYELQGERNQLFVNLVWDEDSDGWALKDGVFHGVEVAGGTSSVDATLPFSLGGVPSSDPAAVSSGRITYLAYPAVYDFELGLAPEVLVDPQGVPSELLVTPGPDADADTVFVQLSREPADSDLINNR